MRPGWVLQGENIAIYCNTIRIEIQTLMKVLRKHQSAEALRRGLPYCSYTCIWHGSYMMWYALICYIYTYNIQLPQDPQGPGTLHNMRNMRSMRSICSARQISKLLPVSFMSFMSLHCRHLPKGGKEVSESRRMFGTTTVAKYGYSWLLIIHKYI